MSVVSMPPSVRKSPPASCGSACRYRAIARLLGQRHLDAGLGRLLTAMVLAPRFAADDVEAVLARLLQHLTLDPGHLAHVVELAVLAFDLAEEAVVAHPVGRHLTQPRAAFRTEVI